MAGLLIVNPRASNVSDELVRRVVAELPPDTAVVRTSALRDDAASENVVELLLALLELIQAAHWPLVRRLLRRPRPPAARDMTAVREPVALLFRLAG